MPGNSVLNSKWGSHANVIQKYYKSGSTLDIGHFDHATGWEMAQDAQPSHLSSEVIPDFSASSSCPPRPIFTLSAEKALWTQGIDKRHDSFLQEVPET